MDVENIQPMSSWSPNLKQVSWWIGAPQSALLTSFQYSEGWYVSSSIAETRDMVIEMYMHTRKTCKMFATVPICHVHVEMKNVKEWHKIKKKHVMMIHIYYIFFRKVFLLKSLYKTTFVITRMIMHTSDYAFISHYSCYQVQAHYYVQKQSVKTNCSNGYFSQVTLKTFTMKYYFTWDHSA